MPAQGTIGRRQKPLHLKNDRLTDVRLRHFEPVLFNIVKYI